MFIWYCLWGLLVRRNVYLILPVRFAWVVKCLSNIACVACLRGEAFRLSNIACVACLWGLPARWICFWFACVAKDFLFSEYLWGFLRVPERLDFKLPVWFAPWSYADVCLLNSSFFCCLIFALVRFCKSRRNREQIGSEDGTYILRLSVQSAFVLLDACLV